MKTKQVILVIVTCWTGLMSQAAMKTSSLFVVEKSNVRA